MNKTSMWIFIVVALIIGVFAGYYYEKSKLTTEMMMVQSDAKKQLDDLKMKNDQLMKGQTSQGDTMMPATPQPSEMMKGNEMAPKDSMTPTGAMIEK